MRNVKKVSTDVAIPAPMVARIKAVKVTSVTFRRP
jgi:hypothetical protein